MGMYDSCYNNDTAAVTEIGNSVEEIGEQLVELMTKVNTEVQTLLDEGLKGKVQLSLNEAYLAVGQSMDDHMKRFTALGAAVSQTAQNTAAMAEEVASKITAVGANA